MKRPISWATTRRTLLWALTTTSLAASLVVDVPGASAAPATVVLSGDAVSGVRLGEPQGRALTRLDQLLGRPTGRLATTAVLENCGVDATASWRSLSAYFDHERLVGVALGPGSRPRGETAQGLRPGDTLARARTIYGRRLTTSTAQGGVWMVRTSTGRLDGFLLPNGPRPTARSRILTIDVGVVGCPALSP